MSWRAKIAGMGGRWIEWLALAGAIAIPRAAWATNGNIPRTPPVFQNQACVTVVDRSVDPVFHLEYTIPNEDTELTEDELPDSRRLQFFALCRDHDHLGDTFGDQRLPNWISQDDVTRSFEADLMETLPSDEDVLDSASMWQAPGHDGLVGSCVQRLSPDAQRLPISCEEAGKDLHWDTTGVPAGNYVIRGYTFEPPFSLWTRRIGVVQVVDDVCDMPPVVSLMSPTQDATGFQSPGYRIVGVASGAPGTTVIIEWATLLAPDLSDPAAWQLVIELEADGSFDIPFAAPDDAVYQAVVFRATATDPSGRSWTSHTHSRLIPFPGEGESEEPILREGFDACTPGHTPTSVVVECPGIFLCSDGSSGDSGCGCRGTTPVSPLWLLGGLALVRRRKTTKPLG